MPIKCPGGGEPRYRFTGSGKNRRRIAFCGNKVVEVTKWPKGGKKHTPKRVSGFKDL